MHQKCKLSSFKTTKSNILHLCYPSVPQIDAIFMVNDEKILYIIQILGDSVIGTTRLQSDSRKMLQFSNCALQLAKILLLMYIQ